MEAQSDLVHDRRDWWAWRVAQTFVLLTLVALVLLPILVQREVDRHRARMESSEPARTHLMGLQFNLVRELSTLSHYALTAERPYAQAFSDARASERQMWRELAPLAADLGTEVHERFVEARTVAEFWHRRLNEDELFRRGRAGLDLLLETELRSRFEDVLRATNRLDSTIVQVTARQRRQIENAERWGLRLTLVSGTLALLAAAAVALLGMRIRRLAAETERRREETAAALEASARAADARQRLLRGITHDVKNPLGAARGYAELLSLGVKGAVNPEQRQLVEGIERSIDGALAIISDLLDLARADSGGISVHPVRTDLNEVVRQAVDDHHAAAEAAGHTIVLDASAGPLTFDTDPVRVRQVLDNLISNAIKYTPPPGRIVVRTESDAKDAPNAWHAAAVRVTDNGPGIPLEQWETIFDEFTRLEDTNGSGHGLGLAIARRLARLLGGELGLAERDGPGATFVLWLPQRERRPDHHERANRVKARGRSA